MALFVFLGWIVDWATATPPEEFFATTAGRSPAWRSSSWSCGRCSRSCSRGFNNLALVPSLTAMVRWQNYRYVLRQSLSFFQNDFAGRIAQKVMQTGPALRETVTSADRRHLDVRRLSGRHGLSLRSARSAG